MLVKIRKRGVPTFWVKRRLSEALGIPLKAIRHAGKKDAAATATQWLSWPIDVQKNMAWPMASEAFEVLEKMPHDNGLGLGHVNANAFELRLKVKGCPDLEFDGSHPFPNFFGTQRFGNGPRKWCEWMSPKAGKKLGKDQVSVVQALLFNDFLEDRYQASGRNFFDDDFWMHLSGKRFFQVTDDSEVRARFESGEISPSGPLFGYKTPLRNDEIAFLERYHLEAENFRSWGKVAKGSRRPLWMRPGSFSSELQDDEWVLNFELPSGVYATVFLLHLLSPQVLWRPMEEWPNFTELIKWRRGADGFELAMV